MNKKSFKDYVDASGEFSNRELVFATWIANNKTKIRQIVTGVLFIICIIFGIYTVYGYGYYFFVGYFRDQNLASEHLRTIHAYNELSKQFTAKQLVFGSTQIYSHTPGKYDFYTTVNNPNTIYKASVEYKYLYDGGETPIQTIDIGPGQSLPFVTYGHNDEGYPRSAVLTIENIMWQTIDLRSIPDNDLFIQTHINFPFSNFTFIKAGTDSTSLPSNSVRFDIYNNTAYSYWDAPFAIELYSNEQMVGVLPLKIEQFRNKQTRAIQINFGTQTGNITAIKLIPLVNIFDPNNYMRPGA